MSISLLYIFIIIETLIQVCPMMHVCPSAEFLSAWEQIPKAMMIKSEVEDKPSCPLCLLAVGQLYNVIKDDKTEVRWR